MIIDRSVDVATRPVSFSFSPGADNTAPPRIGPLGFPSFPPILLLSILRPIPFLEPIRSYIPASTLPTRLAAPSSPPLAIGAYAQSTVIRPGPTHICALFFFPPGRLRRDASSRCLVFGFVSADVPNTTCNVSFTSTPASPSKASRSALHSQHITSHIQNFHDPRSSALRFFAAIPEGIPIEPQRKKTTLTPRFRRRLDDAHSASKLVATPISIHLDSLYTTIPSRIQREHLFPVPFFIWVSPLLRFACI